MNYSAYFAKEKELKAKGFDFERSELVEQFTAGRKNGLSQLSHFEYAEFLRWLNSAFQQATNTEAKKCNQMRRKIIALFHKMGYKLENGNIDMQHVNDWCVKYGHKHKELNSYNYNELCDLLTQAESCYKSFLKAI
jgi:hypothetical protein